MEIDVYFRFLGALIFVLALIGATGWAARRFGLGGRLAPNPGKNRRLSVVEVAVLDSRRKLVLVRRDATEHLLLLGPGQDVLVESRIGTLAAGDTPGDTSDDAPRIAPGDEVRERAAASFKDTLRRTK